VSEVEAQVHITGDISQKVLWPVQELPLYLRTTKARLEMEMEDIVDERSLEEPLLEQSALKFSPEHEVDIVKAMEADPVQDQDRAAEIRIARSRQHLVSQLLV